MQTAQVIPFKFESREVRTLLIDDQPWFVAADVCESLGLSDTNKALIGLDEDEKREHEQYSGSGRKPILINESGLYSMVLRSRKPEAKRFKKWVTAEVLPAIRKHGHYTDSAGRLNTLLGQTIGTDGFHMLGALIKGKVTCLRAAHQRRASAKIWSQTHAAFGVRSAADIPAEHLDAARNFVAAYTLEGEWLTKETPIAQTLSDSDLHNLFALARHTQQISDIYRKYHLYDIFQRLGSRAGVELHDHVIGASSMAGNLRQRFGAAIQVAQQKTGIRKRLLIRPFP